MPPENVPDALFGLAPGSLPTKKRFLRSAVSSGGDPRAVICKNAAISRTMITAAWNHRKANGIRNKSNKLKIKVSVCFCRFNLRMLQWINLLSPMAGFFACFRTVLNLQSVGCERFERFLPGILTGFCSERDN